MNDKMTAPVFTAHQIALAQQTLDAARSELLRLCAAGAQAALIQQAESAVTSARVILEYRAANAAR
jgi:hypothetical protein